MQYDDAVPTNDLAALREAMAADERYFEHLIERYILNSQHWGMTRCIPSRTLTEEKRSKMALRFAAEAEKIQATEGGYAALETYIAEFNQYLTAPDSPEAEASVPHLSPADINTTSNVRDMAEETAKVKRENDLLREAQDKRNTEERRDQLAAKRESEIAELRKEFPDFDLAAESKNPQFVSMLRIEALPLRTIYAAIHHDEILSDSVQKARADAEEAAVANIRARGMRPPENGATVTGGVSVSVGVGSLSRKERADVARRAARGERITFRS